MTNINTGGPAYPRASSSRSSGFDAAQDGMSLRDYYAGQALGLMCSSNIRDTGTFATPEGRKTVADVCFLMADAMLAARRAP